MSLITVVKSWFQSDPPKPQAQLPRAATEPTPRITLPAYLMGRDADPRYAQECTAQVMDNAEALLLRVNRALDVYGYTPRVNSGWRPKAINASVGGAQNSHHVTGCAVDLGDPDGILKRWCASHLDVLEQCGLWMEEPRSTPTWVHWQSVAPASGNRVFIP